MVIFLGALGVSLTIMVAVGVFYFRRKKTVNPAAYLPPMKKGKKGGTEVKETGSKHKEPLVDCTKKYYRKIDILSDVLIGPLLKEAARPDSKIRRGTFINKELVEKFTSENCAVKLFTDDNLSSDAKFENEMIILKALSPHTSILTILGYCRDPKAIIMKPYELNLKTWLLNNKATFEQKEEFGLQLALGLDHLHGNAIVHFDFKPSNILLKQREKLVVLISNFGYSKLLGSTVQMRPLEKTKLTIDYVSPEVSIECYNNLCLISLESQL